METVERKQKSKRKILIIGVSLLIVLLVLGGLFYYLRTNNKSSQSVHDNDPADNTISAESTNTGDNFDYKGEEPKTETEPTDSSDPYSLYDSGELALNSKDYQQALDFFNQALALRNNDANFYIGKSQAQVGLGKRNDAIATVNQGLSVLPNNETLLTQLDVLQNVVK